MIIVVSWSGETDSRNTEKPASVSSTKRASFMSGERNRSSILDINLPSAGKRAGPRTASGDRANRAAEHGPQVGMSFNPFDLAATRGKLLNGFHTMAFLACRYGDFDNISSPSGGRPAST